MGYLASDFGVGQRRRPLLILPEINAREDAVVDGLTQPSSMRRNTRRLIFADGRPPSVPFKLPPPEIISRR